MKYLLALACFMLIGCDESDTIYNEVIFVQESACAFSNTVIAWDDSGQDYLITYCTCDDYENVGPADCPGQ